MKKHSEVLPIPKTFLQILATSLKLPPFPPLSLLPYPFLFPCTMTTAPTLSKSGTFFFGVCCFLRAIQTELPLVMPISQLYLPIFTFH